jgi:hypothetical protein
MSATRSRKRKEPPKPASTHQPLDDSSVVQSITYWAGPVPIRSIIRSSNKNFAALNDERNWVTREWNPQNDDEVGVEDDEPRWLVADAGEGLLAADIEDVWPPFVPPPPKSSSVRRSRRVAASFSSRSRSTRTSEQRRGGLKRDQNDNFSDSGSNEGRKERSHARRSKRLRFNSGHDNHKSSSRVGNDYQVSILPVAGAFALKRCDGDVLWDPVQAQGAIQRGEDIDDFLEKGKELPVCTLLMEALHKTGYDTTKAMSEFIKKSKLDKRLEHVTVSMSDEERTALADLFHKHGSTDKDFAAIAKSTGYSMEKVLVQWYRWKGDRREVYNKCKQDRLRSHESDYCCKCDDGGILIVCDLCKKSYHVSTAPVQAYPFLQPANDILTHANSLPHRIAQMSGPTIAAYSRRRLVLPGLHRKVTCQGSNVVRDGRYSQEESREAASSHGQGSKCQAYQAVRLFWC